MAWAYAMRSLWTAVAVVAVVYGLVVLSQLRRAEAPYAALRSFTERQDVSTELKELGAMRVDEMKLFAQAACVQGPEIELVRMAMRKQLRGVPQAVVEDVLESALVEGVSTQNSVQNTTAGIETDGRGYSYLAFWSTEFNGDRSLLAAVYSTCVMVSGIEILVGEDVAEWETTQQSRIVGYEPCHCGFFRCERCPLMEETTNRRPIMKRHRLTLQNQLDLHQWMVKAAVERARVLVESRGKIGNSWFEQLAPPRYEIESAQSWEPPSKRPFQVDGSLDAGERTEL